MGLYKVVKSIIPEEQVNQLSDIIKNLPKQPGDEQVPKSNAFPNIHAISTLQGQLVEKLSKITKKRLVPTYTYTRIYLNGAELTPHKDRPSCEYSVTINLYKSHPWPIYMNKKSVELEPGDGVVYKGCEIEHSRKKFEGDEYIQVFLHYVDADGPYKDHIYDKIVEAPKKTFEFLFEDSAGKNSTNCVRIEDAVSPDVIEKFLKTIENVKLTKGHIGNGHYVPEKRTSDVYWLPKTEEYFDIYEIFHKVVGDINSKVYKFKIKSIVNDIQYTVYNSEDQGHYDWHVDVSSEHSTRKLSVVMQLSDPEDYEGGELQLNTGEIDVVKKQKGMIVIFPSYILHRVTPVTKGVRKTLVLWIDGPPFS